MKFNNTFKHVITNAKQDKNVHILKIKQYIFLLIDYNHYS